MNIIYYTFLNNFKGKMGSVLALFEINRCHFVGRHNRLEYDIPRFQHWKQLVAVRLVK